MYLFSFCVEFIAHTQILTPLSSFYHKILSNWLKFVGFVAFASFDETLSITHKKIIDKSFFSWVISNRKAVSFFMIRSVVIILTKNILTNFYDDRIIICIMYYYLLWAAASADRHIRSCIQCQIKSRKT